MIQLDNLTKSFDGFTALDALNLNVSKGSIYGLVGINGSGKTTAIKHLSGVYRQDGGQALIDGAPVYDNAAIKARVGHIPDELYFFPQYSMRLLRRFYRSLYKNWNDDRCTQMMSDFKLDEKRRLKHFSKGMQKQAAFVLNMSIMPDVLLLDEPIDGLDPIVRKQVLKQIKDDVADRQMTVLISSHNLKEMDGTCDAIGIIKDGRMVVQRDINDLKSNIHKLQLAFAPGTDPDCEGLNVLRTERRGSVWLMIIKGGTDEIDSRVKAQGPLVYDRLPLTLEEIFEYESEGASDEIPY
jgi:ABC-2 type transport system ATP-binding protein